MTRFERATSRSQSERFSQTELHSVTAHRQGFEPQRIVLETIMLPVTSSMHRVLYFHIIKCYSLQDLSLFSKVCSDLQSCRLDREHLSTRALTGAYASISCKVMLPRPLLIGEISHSETLMTTMIWCAPYGRCTLLYTAKRSVVDSNHCYTSKCTRRLAIFPLHQLE